MCYNDSTAVSSSHCFLNDNMPNSSERVQENFDKGFHPRWVRFCIGHSALENGANAEGNRTARLIVDGAVENELSDAEIDDHRTAPRWNLHWMPPLRLSVRA